jgi:hypothetical protein
LRRLFLRIFDAHCSAVLPLPLPLCRVIAARDMRRARVSAASVRRMLLIAAFSMLRHYADDMLFATPYTLMPPDSRRRHDYAAAASTPMPPAMP